MRARRIELNISTYQLAERTGLKAANIGRLESCKYPPNLVTIMRYAEGIDAEVVVGQKANTSFVLTPFVPALKSRAD